MRTATKLESENFRNKISVKIQNKNKLQSFLGGRYAGCCHLFPFLYRFTRLQIPNIGLVKVNLKLFSFDQALNSHSSFIFLNKVA